MGLSPFCNSPQYRMVRTQMIEPHPRVLGLVLCTSRADSSTGVPWARAGSSPALDSTRVGSSLLASSSWLFEQGFTSQIEPLRDSSRLGQGSTSRHDSRLEPLGSFLAVSWRLESRSGLGSSLESKVPRAEPGQASGWTQLKPAREQHQLGSGFRIVGLVKSWTKDQLVSQKGRRGLDLTEISSPFKSGPVKNWSNMWSLQASLSSLKGF